MTSSLWLPKVLEPDFYPLKGYQLAWFFCCLMVGIALGKVLNTFWRIFFPEGGEYPPILPLFLGAKTISAEDPLSGKICQIVIDTFL